MEEFGGLIETSECDPAKVFHYGFVVSNMERALKTWRGQGAKLVVPPAIDPIQNVTCAFMIYLGCMPIELVAPLPVGPNPIAGRLSKGGGLDHVCLFSNDLEADVAKMEASGGVVVVPPCYGAVFKRRLAFVVTRVGMVVELMTRKTAESAVDDPLQPFFLRRGGWMS